MWSLNKAFMKMKKALSFLSIICPSLPQTSVTPSTMASPLLCHLYTLRRGHKDKAQKGLDLGLRGLRFDTTS
jgi:hypothetical protein